MPIPCRCRLPLYRVVWFGDHCEGFYVATADSRRAVLWRCGNVRGTGWRPLTRGIRKSPITNGLLEAEGFRSDASAEPDHHTTDKAIHLFADENYRLVESLLRVSLPRPTFGENLTATGVREEQVYVGDLFQVGEAAICVTQPTERCKTIGLSAGTPKILKVLHELEVCGFYARVVKPGRFAVSPSPPPPAVR